MYELKAKATDGKLAEKAKKTAAKLIPTGKTVSKDMTKEKEYPNDIPLVHPDASMPVGNARPGDTEE